MQHDLSAAKGQTHLPTYAETKVTSTGESNRKRKGSKIKNLFIDNVHEINKIKLQYK